MQNSLGLSPALETRPTQITHRRPQSPPWSFYAGWLLTAAVVGMLVFLVDASWCPETPT